MKIVVFAIAILIIIECIIIMIKPSLYKQALEFIQKGLWLYLAGAIKIVVGIVFLISARECGIPWIIIVLGILTLAGGLSTFMIKMEKWKALLEWIRVKPDIAIRMLGLCGLVFGAVLLYAA